MMRRILVFSVLYLLLSAVPASASIIFNGAYTLTGSDPEMSPRINRDGVSSDWGVTRPFPGEFSSGFFTYQLFEFNSGDNPFLQVTFDSNDSDGNIMAALYSSVFNPDDLAFGWLADGGLSTGSPASSVSFRYEGQANTDYMVLLFDVNDELTTGGICVEGFSEALDPRPPACAIDFDNQLLPGSQSVATVPVTDTMYLVLLAGLPLVFGRIRRSRAR